MGVTQYWTAGQVHRLLDALATRNRHQACSSALIMWRNGLRISEVFEREWRDSAYASDPRAFLTRSRKAGRARTVRVRPELVELFTNWPASRSSWDRVMQLAMRSMLRHIDDGIAWADHDEESPATGKRRPGARSLRHSAARHCFMNHVLLNVAWAWLVHASVHVTLRIYLLNVGSDDGMENVP